MHGEKAPSMCFFPDGKYHCFGCGAHGDAADLYAALHSVSLSEALRICRGESYSHKHVTPAENTRQKVERWYSEQWAEACRKKHGAIAGMAREDSDFWTFAAAHAEAEDKLNHLESVQDDPVGKTLLYMEAQNARR